jgi:hypothetical protein
MRIVGIILVVLGLCALLFGGGLNYNKTENVAQIGDLKMQVTEKKQVMIPPIASGIAIGLGVILFFMDTRRKGA